MTRKMAKRLMVLTCMIALIACFGVTSAFAGNIILTGHDNDFHQSTGARAQTTAMMNFARAGSTNPGLKVLAFDQGSELTSLLTLLGIAFDNVDLDAPGPAGNIFNPATYSAMVVASHQSCGGCDNTVATSNYLLAHQTDINAFFNAGGGIVSFTSGSEPTYYNWLPQVAAAFGSPGSTGFYQTPAGATLGVPAVNGDATHNFFREPGTFGTSSLWQVLERNTVGTTDTADDPAETIALSGGAIICPPEGCIIVVPPPTGAPEPSSLVLLGTSLIGLSLAAWRKRS